jgi:hypothetical protein
MLHLIYFYSFLVKMHTVIQFLSAKTFFFNLNIGPQAVFHRGVLRTCDADEQIVDDDVSWEVPYVYFGIFDGHAGSGCAVTAANELHQVRTGQTWQAASPDGLFQTKNPILGKFWRSLHWTMLIYFMDIWDIL